MWTPYREQLLLLRLGGEALNQLSSIELALLVVRQHILKSCVPCLPLLQCCEDPGGNLTGCALRAELEESDNTGGKISRCNLNPTSASG